MHWAEHHVQSGAQYAARAGAAGAVVGIVHDRHAHLRHCNAQQQRARKRRLRPLSRPAELQISIVTRPAFPSLPSACSTHPGRTCCWRRPGDKGACNGA